MNFVVNRVMHIEVVKYFSFKLTFKKSMVPGYIDSFRNKTLTLVPMFCCALAQCCALVLLKWGFCEKMKDVEREKIDNG